MRALRNAGSLFCAVLLASIVFSAVARAQPSQVPSYIKLMPGTLAVGGVDDLVEEEQALRLFPVCSQPILEVELAVGFFVEEKLTPLDVYATIDTPGTCEASLYLRNYLKGAYDFVQSFEIRESDIVLKGIPADTKEHWDAVTSEIELLFVIRCDWSGWCGPTSTEDDAVVVQDVTIGPTPKKSV